MRKILLVSVLGAVVLLVWSSVVWMATPLPATFIKTVPNQSAAVMLLDGFFSESGMYVLPQPEGGNWQDPNFQAAYQNGPRVQVFIDKAGGDPMMQREMGLALLHHFISIFIVAFFVAQFADRMQKFSRRFIAAWALGGLASFQVILDYIWWPQPLDYVGFIFVSNLIGWALVALLVAKLIKPGCAACKTC